MILVDTSVWIDFFRGRSATGPLQGLLDDNQVICHPWVIGELALGSLGRGRTAILGDLKALPSLLVSTFDEVSAFLEEGRLYGRGLSFVDLHLLHASLAHDCRLWTHDKTLRHAATAFRISF